MSRLTINELNTVATTVCLCILVVISVRSWEYIPYSSQDWLLTAVLVSTPHWLYAFTWTQPQKFIAICKVVSNVHPVDCFANLAGLIKVMQLAVILQWYVNAAPMVSLASITALRWLAVVVLVGVGQILNISVMTALGRPGVYYGCKLGKEIPWYHGFPFTVTSHPQYIGSILSTWGIVLLLSTPAHFGGLVGVGLVMSYGWCVSSYIENY